MDLWWQELTPDPMLRHAETGANTAGNPTGDNNLLETVTHTAGNKPRTLRRRRTPCDNYRWESHEAKSCQPRTPGAPARQVASEMSSFAAVIGVDGGGHQNLLRRGEQYTVLVRQITSVQAYRRPGPELGVRPAVAAEGRGGLVRWRPVFGAFQVAIPVHTKAVLLPGEERQLSILRWIQEAIDPHSRWHKVFTRYLGQLADWVDGLGGASGDVQPSPTGDWHRPGPGEAHRHATGKGMRDRLRPLRRLRRIRAGHPHGERRYVSREKDLAQCRFPKELSNPRRRDLGRCAASHRSVPALVSPVCHFLRANARWHGYQRA